MPTLPAPEFETSDDNNIVTDHPKFGQQPFTVFTDSFQNFVNKIISLVPYLNSIFQEIDARAAATFSEIDNLDNAGVINTVIDNRAGNQTLSTSNDAGVDTKLAEFINAGETARPLIVDFFFTLTSDTNNKLLKIKMNGNNLANFQWNFTSSSQSVRLRVHVCPDDSDNQTNFAEIHGSGTLNAKVKKDTSAIPTSGAPDLTIQVFANSANAGVITADRVIYQQL